MWLTECTSKKVMSFVCQESHVHEEFYPSVVSYWQYGVECMGSSGRVAQSSRLGFQISLPTTISKLMCNFIHPMAHVSF